MKSEKFIIGFLLLVIISLTIFGIVSGIRFNGVESAIEASLEDVNRITELEQRIAGFESSIIDLEQRETDIRIKYSELEAREEQLNVRSREITLGEKVLIKRKADLENGIRINLVELNRQIEKSRKLVEYIKDKYAGHDNDNNP